MSDSWEAAAAKLSAEVPRQIWEPLHGAVAHPGYPDNGRASPSLASRGGLWEELAASNGPGLVLPTATVGADLSGTPHSGRTGCAIRAVLRCGTGACVCGLFGESSGSHELRVRDSLCWVEQGPAARRVPALLEEDAGQGRRVP